jgi:alpha-tubulin suppressor-like RCC1 family protein
MRVHTAIFRGFMVPFVALLAGCGDASGPDDDGRTATLQVAGGNGQQAVVTAALPAELAVVALGADGAPVAGTVVRFTVSAGGGEVSPANVTTDAQGRAATTWTFGTLAGAHRVTATAGTAAAEFTAIADAGLPVSFALAQDSFALEPGMDSVLHFIALDAHGNVNTAVQPVFSVDHPGVASVSASGGVIAVSPGRTTVRAQLGGFQDEATLTVGFQFIDITTGYDHVCARTAGNRVHCWGLTEHFQAGAPRAGEVCVVDAFCLRSPKILTDDVAFTAVGPGFHHSCGVGNAQALYCWGSNALWALGIGQNDWTYRADLPMEVDPSRTYAAVSADENYACALTTQGAALCWGKAAALGAGPPPALPVEEPAPVAGGLTFASIQTSAENACGITAQGEAHCWGSNGNGQLGVGDRQRHDTPVRTAAALQFKAFALGALHACGIAADDRAYCWGSNSHGQLGVEVLTESLAPVPVATTLTFTAIAAGGTHTCAIATGGAAYCWGSNYDGQLGNGFVGSGWQPRAVAGGLAFTRIHTKRDFTCAIATDARAYCWGDNDYGQIGDGSVTDRVAPVRVLGQM